MKKILIFMVSAVMTVLLSGCAVYEQEGDEVLVPLYDGMFGLSFLRANAEIETLPVNITKEQGDEIFGSIEVYGANLTLPMRVSDLPAGFEMNDEFDEEDLIKVSETLYTLDRRLYVSGGKDTVSVASAGILMEGNDAEALRNGYIVSLDLEYFIDNADSSVKIKGVSVGALYNEELTEAYGEGYCYLTDYSKYVSRVYYDGERRLQLLYGGVWDENGEVDIERSVKEGAVFSMNLTAFPLYEMMYRFDEGGI